MAAVATAPSNKEALYAAGRKYPRGTLSAKVKPQPPGRPMLIRTPSAVAEVVGTAFDLTARTEDTLLKVNEGLVKLKRLPGRGGGKQQRRGFAPNGCATRRRRHSSTARPMEF